MGVLTSLLVGPICAVVLYGVWYCYKAWQEWKEYQKIMDTVPGPPYYFLLGNVLDFLGHPEALFLFLRNCSKKFKYATYRFWSGPLGVINCVSPDDVEQLLTSNKHIEKSLVYHPILPWLGTGLLTSTGEKWQTRRKILTPAFHFNILQEFSNVFVEQSIRLVDKLKSEIDQNGTNVVPLITETTLRSICETAMGTTLDTNDEKANEYHKAIYRIGEIVFMRLTRIWLYIEWVFNLTPFSKEQTKLIKVLHNFSTSVIEARKTTFQDDLVKNYIEVTENTEEKFDEKPKKRLAMLDLLLSAKARGEDIDDEGIREEVDTFMFEGHDTTSMAISFILMVLACYKDEQDKIYEELLEIFGNSDRPPSYNDLQKVPYMDRCIKESLRLYPSVPLISRLIREPMTTRSGYFLPEDTMIHIHIYDIHRNPEIYPNPEKFDPDRFLPEATKDRHPFAYIPFSAGPRNCIGQRFALLEIKTVVSYILRNFSMDPVDTPENIIIIPDLVLRSKNGIRVKFNPRR